MKNQLKVCLVHMGCAKNLVDSEVMIGLIKKGGHKIVNDYDKADSIIINTCCFIKPSERESHKVIRKFSKLRAKGAYKKLIVTGCLPQRYKDKVLRKYPSVDFFLGSSDFSSIEKYLKEDTECLAKINVGKPNFLYSADLPRINSQQNFTAYIKIAEGCSERCTYCIIPKIRGRYRSRPIKDIVKEVKNLVDKGLKEAVLIAQNVTGYGKDIYGKPEIVKLLKSLCRIDGLKWIRLLYNYPSDFSDELIDLIAHEEKICKYIEMPLQQVNNDILKKMGRRISKEETINLINKLKMKINGLVIRTTFIVGFPGETRDKYQELKDFVNKYKLTKVTAFPYYKEKGTLAHDFESQVSEKTKIFRYNDFTRLQKRNSLNMHQRFLEKKFDVLIEKRVTGSSGYNYRGRFYGQAPEIDGYVYVKGGTNIEIGTFYKVKFLKADSFDFFGEII